MMKRLASGNALLPVLMFLLIGFGLLQLIVTQLLLKCHVIM